MKIKWACLLLFFCVFKVQAGGVDSGGGHIVFHKPANRYMLLDFYVNNPEVPINIKESSCSSLSLDSNMYHRHLGYDYFSPFELCQGSFKKFWQQIKSKWQGQLPFLLSLIESTFQQMIFRYRLEQYGIAVREWFWWPENLPYVPIQLAALYYSTEGTVINAPSWNRLDYYSKFGLILHEALKQFELRYHYHFGPKRLQNLVHNLVFMQPSEINLLQGDRLPDYLLNLEEQYQLNGGEQDEMVMLTRQQFQSPFDRIGRKARSNDKLIVLVLEGKLSIHDLPSDIPWFRVKENLLLNRQDYDKQIKAGILLNPDTPWPSI